MAATTAKFGTWKSPITVETITAESTDIVEVVTTVGLHIAPHSIEYKKEAG